MIRDCESAQIALSTAEIGHLVCATEKRFSNHYGRVDATCLAARLLVGRERLGSGRDVLYWGHERRNTSHLLSFRLRAWRRFRRAVQGSDAADRTKSDHYRPHA